MIEENTFNLAAYFARIGYHGSGEATLETLCTLHQLHPQSIAFENIDIVLQRPVNLDVHSLEQKLVQGGRGGYCFEHNGLFSQVLHALKFRVSGLIARVLWNQPDDVLTRREHMLLRVDLAGVVYIVDVGFGGMTLTAPLRLDTGSVQATPHESFRIVRAGDDYMVLARIAGYWKPLYYFDLQQQFNVDYEMANYYLSAHPASYFRDKLMAARVAPDGRYTLLNKRLTFHRAGGQSELRELNLSELPEVLREIFHLSVRSQELNTALTNLNYFK